MARVGEVHGVSPIVLSLRVFRDDGSSSGSRLTKILTEHPFTCIECGGPREGSGWKGRRSCHGRRSKVYFIICAVEVIAYSESEDNDHREIQNSCESVGWLGTMRTSITTK